MLSKKVITLVLLLSISFISAQNQTAIDKKREQFTYQEGKEVPFAILTKIPVFPNFKCNKKPKKCFSLALENYILDNFNKKFVFRTDNYQNQKMYYIFTLTEKGEITNINVRATTTKLKKELTRVLKTMPMMQPGEYFENKAIVKFSQPIELRKFD